MVRVPLPRGEKASTLPARPLVADEAALICAFRSSTSGSEVCVILRIHPPLGLRRGRREGGEGGVRDTVGAGR